MCSKRATQLNCVPVCVPIGPYSRDALDNEVARSEDLLSRPVERNAHRVHTGLACYQEKSGQYRSTNLCKVMRTEKLNGSSESRTEGFCFVPLVILPQCVFQNRFRREVVFHKVFPKHEAEFLVIIRETRFPGLRHVKLLTFLLSPDNAPLNWSNRIMPCPCRLTILHTQGASQTSDRGSDTIVRTFSVGS